MRTLTERMRGYYARIKQLVSIDTKVYPDGSVYKGGWKNGKPHGEGTMTYADKTMLKGKWEEGKSHGKAEITAWGSDTSIVRFDKGEAKEVLNRDGEWSTQVPIELAEKVYGLPVTFRNISSNGSFSKTTTDSYLLTEFLTKDSKGYPIEFSDQRSLKYIKLPGGGKLNISLKDIDNFLPNNSHLKKICVMPCSIEINQGGHALVVIIDPNRGHAYFIDSRQKNSMMQIRQKAMDYIQKELKLKEKPQLVLYPRYKRKKVLNALRSGACVNIADATMVLFSAHFRSALRKKIDSKLEITADDINSACDKAIKNIKKVKMSPIVASDIMRFMPSLEVVNKEYGARKGYNITPIDWPVYPDWPEGHAEPKGSEPKRKGHDDNVIDSIAKQKRKDNKVWNDDTMIGYQDLRASSHGKAEESRRWDRGSVGRVI